MGAAQPHARLRRPRQSNTAIKIALAEPESLAWVRSRRAEVHKDRCRHAFFLPESNLEHASKSDRPKIGQIVSGKFESVRVFRCLAEHQVQARLAIDA